MRSTVLALFVSLLCMLPNIAYAWGSQGHEIVGGISDRAAYLKAKNALQKKQLAKAGAHLAQLLNKVFIK